MSAVYLYGVALAEEQTDGAARRIVHGELAALVSDVERGPLAAASELRAHWRVLEQAASRATVLPVRFGTVMESDDAVVGRFLAPGHDRLVAHLAELSGKVQLTLKAFYEEERLMRDVVEGSPAVARLRERVRGRPEAATYYERIELGELVSAAVEQTRERDSVMVLGRLEPLAVAARREAVATPDGAINAAFLVERSHLDEFSRAVAQLGDELNGRMRLRYVGPLPPYSFTDGEVAAWA